MTAEPPPILASAVEAFLERGRSGGAELAGLSEVDAAVRMVGWPELLDVNRAVTVAARANGYLHREGDKDIPESWGRR